MYSKDITAEESAVELRKIVQSLTGMDPRVGQVIRPIQPVSEEDTQRFMNKLFSSRGGRHVRA